MFAVNDKIKLMNHFMADRNYTARARKAKFETSHTNNLCTAIRTDKDIRFFFSV